MTEMTYTGRCFCGDITFEVDGPIKFACFCHCESCRRATSAPFTSFFGVPRDSVRWSGELDKRLTSEGRVARKFCSACGTQMTYQWGGWPDETHHYAATMDDHEQFEPQAHYHWAEKQHWVVVDDDLPKYPGSADNTEPVA